MILWTMKFRARLTDGLSIRKFYQLIQTMAKLSKNACVFRLAPDHFYLMAVGGMAPGGDVWVQGKPRDLFQEYQMEGVTPTENEIYLQLEPDALAKNLVALKNTHSAQSVKLKLTKKRDSPCLSFDLELAPGNVAASGTCRQVTHDFPVVLIPRSQWTEFQEPAIPPFQVSIYLPELKLVKSLVDRYKNMGKRMTMEANNQGKLRFVLESDTLKVITHFAHCARPKFDESLNQSRNMSDQITLNVGSKSFEVSKSHLVKISSYFEVMFSSPFAEKDQTEITLKDVNPHEFEAVLQFTQGKSIPIDDENVYEVLKIADMFDLKVMTSHCQKYLVDHLEHDKALKVWKAADMYGLTSLAKRAKSFILWHFPTLSTQQSWDDLSLEDFYSIVSCPELHVTPDTDLLKLIRHRLEACSPQDSNVCRLSLLKAIQDPSAPLANLKSRKLPIQPSVQGSSGYIHSFHLKTSSLSRPVCLPPFEQGGNCPVGIRTCAIGPYIYSLGGEEVIGRSNWNRKVWRYDTILQVWDCVMELPSPIRHMGICTDNDRNIFLVGGYGRFRVKSDAVFKLDMNARTCETLSPLPCPMNSPPCCVFDHDLFVFGPNLLRGSWSDKGFSWTSFEFDASRLPKGCNLSFKMDAAVTSATAIFLAQGYHLFKFSPEPKSYALELMGQFKDECVHMCMVEDRIYKFDASSDEASIEVFDTHSNRFDIIWTGERTMDSIIHDLLAHNLNPVVREIFLNLSSSDLMEAKLVCHLWRDFINEWIEQSIPGRKRLESKLRNNWRQWKVMSSRLYIPSNEVFDIKWDQDEAFCGTCDGFVDVFDRRTSRRKIAMKLHGNSCVQLDINHDLIVSVGEDSFINVVDRKSFCRLQRLDDHRGPIWGVKIYKNKVVTCGGDCMIHIYEIGQDFQLRLLDRLRHHQKSVSHVEVDRDMIVSGSEDKYIKVYNMVSKEMVRVFKCQFSILCLDYSHPYIAAIPNKGYNSLNFEIWSMNQELSSQCLISVEMPVRHFDPLDLKMTKDYLSVAIERAEDFGDEPIGYRAITFSMEDLLQNPHPEPIHTLEIEEYFDNVSIHLDQTSIAYSQLRSFRISNFWQ
ncbi:hypothetical protein TCAL_06413 [Tigriopus californicus]|uniref:BTB domain-containing protein n=1 Tax=Tigriopus californicus TaxID=6832 RepID=A0A553PCS1_TIGCA|nr:hypothetical protein TCAL_06413 [Tigriopus californicus]